MSCIGRRPASLMMVWWSTHFDHFFLFTGFEYISFFWLVCVDRIYFWISVKINKHHNLFEWMGWYVLFFKSIWSRSTWLGIFKRIYFIKQLEGWTRLDVPAYDYFVLEKKCVFYSKENVFSHKKLLFIQFGTWNSF